MPFSFIGAVASCSRPRIARASYRHGEDGEQPAGEREEAQRARNLAAVR